MQMGGMQMGGMQMGEMQRDNFDNEPTGPEQNRHRIINGEFETEDDKKLD